MFDTITVEMPLPQYGDYVNFQTKSINNALDHYIINEHGELLLREYDNVLIKEGDPDAENFLDRFPAYEQQNIRYKPTKHNGVVVFYDSYKGEEETDFSGWIEYRALFVDGLLQGSIDLINHEEPRNRTPEEQIEFEKIKEKNKKIRENYIQKRIDKVKQAREQIASLSKVQDFIFDNLIEDLNIVSEEDKDWVFDAVFNDTEHSWEKLKDVL